MKTPVNYEGGLGRELPDGEVGKGDVWRVGGFDGESGEDLRAGVDAAGGAELGEVFGEERLEDVGILAGSGGEELALKGSEVVGEGRVGGGGDGDSLSLGRKPRSQKRDLGTRVTGREGCPRGLRLVLRNCAKKFFKVPIRTGCARVWVCDALSAHRYPA